MRTLGLNNGIGWILEEKKDKQETTLLSFTGWRLNYPDNVHFYKKEIFDSK